MGWQLVNTLVRQLQGEIEVSGPPGTSVTVEFPLEEQNESGMVSDRER